MSKREKLINRFWSKANKPNPYACWEWLAGKHRSGYGEFKLNGKTTKAHRVAYELTLGIIPDGYHVHHECENKACVNPLHLKALRPFDHLSSHTKTHCLNGHPRVPENLQGKGNRGGCKTCRREHYIANRVEIRAQQNAYAAQKRSHRDLSPVSK